MESSQLIKKLFNNNVAFSYIKPFQVLLSHPVYL